MRRIEDVCIKAIMAATPPVVAACKMFVPHRNNCFGNANGAEITMFKNLIICIAWILIVVRIRYSCRFGSETLAFRSEFVTFVGL